MKSVKTEGPDENCRQLSELHRKIQQLLEEILLKEQALHDLGEHCVLYRQLIDNAKHGMWIEDLATSRMLYVNPSCAEMFSTSQDALMTQPHAWTEPVHPEDLQRIINQANEKAKDPTWTSTETVYRLLKPDGQITWVRDVTVPIRDRNGQIVRAAGIIEDFTDRKRSDDALREWSRKIEVLHDIAQKLATMETEEGIYNLTIEALNTLIGLNQCLICDFKDKRLTIVQSSIKNSDLESDLLALSENEVINLLKTQNVIFQRKMALSLEKDQPKSSGFYRYLTPIGQHTLFQAVTDTPQKYDSNILRIMDLLLSHTRESLNRRRLQMSLKQQAIRDPLTGLFNRYFLNQVLHKEMKRSERYNRTIAFLMIDIDRFKEINDQLGHLTGDKILNQIARIIEMSVRESDTVIRYGGDEFLIILPEANGEVNLVRERIQNTLVQCDDVHSLIGFNLTVSIGVAYWKPDLKQTVEEVLAEADREMYIEKRAKKGKGP